MSTNRPLSPLSARALLKQSQIILASLFTTPQQREWIITQLTYHHRNIFMFFHSAHSSEHVSDAEVSQFVIFKHCERLPSSSLVPLFLLVSWLPPLASGLPVVFVFCPWCCSESEDSVNNSRIQHSNCLWFTLTFSPCVLEFTSGTVALHSVF